ncbi:uncharacterized protein [Amphiura filiformis]|uniref:uncharacterized protein n=1 Tax=Amphiura filiformis TaxID=82378 RepID=UPI003B2117F6
MATSDFDQWTTAKYTPSHIVTNYSLPLPVKVGSGGHYVNEIPEIQNGIFFLETTMHVNQVTARVEDTRKTTSADSEAQTIINVPQMYPGLFKIVMDKETPVRLFSVYDILLKMPRYVKVVESPTNIPKEALITLKIGDLLEIKSTCEMTTRDGIKDFLRCTIKSRTLVLDPAWNGVYQTVNTEGIMYSITEVLERFPLPVTIKPVKLDKHSKVIIHTGDKFAIFSDSEWVRGWEPLRAPSRMTNTSDG